MTDRKRASALATRARSGASAGVSFGARVGFARLPSRPSSATSSLEKEFTQQTRSEMEDVIQRFTRLVADIKGATPDILAEAFLPTFELSLLYVPYKTGALQSTGKLEPVYDASKPKAVISYGDALVNYAAIVHERVDLFHMPPTRSKYLQAALEETLDEIRPRVIKLLRSAIGN